MKKQRNKFFERFLEDLNDGEPRHIFGGETRKVDKIKLKIKKPSPSMASKVTIASDDSSELNKIKAILSKIPYKSSGSAKNTFLLMQELSQNQSITGVGQTQKKVGKPPIAKNAENFKSLSKGKTRSQSAAKRIGSHSESQQVAQENESNLEEEKEEKKKNFSEGKAASN